MSTASVLKDISVPAGFPPPVAMGRGQSLFFRAIIYLPNQTGKGMMPRSEVPVDLRNHTDGRGCVLPPWEAFPGQLVSWWQMQQFSAHHFYYAARALGSLKMDCLFNPDGRGEKPLPLGFFDVRLDDQTKANALRHLGQIEEASRVIGLDILCAMLRRAIADINREPTIRFSDLTHHVDTFSSLLEEELSKRLFMYIPPELAKFWPKESEPYAFGMAVATAFPSTNYDGAQAGIAIASRLSTAAVFHLMRVLEIGLGVIGKPFMVSLAHTNWAPAIEQLESRIREMHKDPTWKALPDCKEQQEFYAQAASHCGLLKDAWRNYTMHVRGKFTEEEAQQIFGNVKAFMQKLAERLSEQP